MKTSSNIAITLALVVSGISLAMLARKRNAVPSLINQKQYDMSTNTNLPRGYRNNNPLNIRYNKFNSWKGKVIPNTDRNNTFEQFVSMPYGYRAALYLLRKYIKSYGCDTLAKIISKWAPANENNTQAYIQHVSEMTGIAPSQYVSPTNKDMMCKLAYAMSIVENGNTAETKAAGLPNMDIIYAGYNLL